MKKKQKLLPLFAFLMLSISLSGCSDLNNTDPPKVPESKETDMDGTEKNVDAGSSSEESSEEAISKDGTSKEAPSDSIDQAMKIVEDAFVNGPSGTSINKKEIADRILSRFQNQILEWYYSDVHLRSGLPYGKTQNLIRDIDLTPGNKLYYRILSASGTNTFQVQYSDEASFEQYFLRDYSYQSERGEVSEYKFTGTPDQLISFGEFVISDSFSVSDDQEYRLVNEEFHALWNGWLSANASTDLRSPLKAAYLMPFSVEEDGSADMCVFLEVEDGTWIMARPSIISYSDRDFSTAPEWAFERKVGWHQSSDYLIVSPHFLSEEDVSFKVNLLGEESELVIFRAYEPTESGYIVRSYEEIQGSGWRGPEGSRIGGGPMEPKNGDFLSGIPELAEEKLY